MSTLFCCCSDRSCVRSRFNIAPLSSHLLCLDLGDNEFGTNMLINSAWIARNKLPVQTCDDENASDVAMGMSAPKLAYENNGLPYLTKKKPSFRQWREKNPYKKQHFADRRDVDQIIATWNQTPLDRALGWKPIWCKPKKNCAVCLTFLWNSVPSKIQKSSRIIRWFGGLRCTTLVDFLSFSLLTPSLTVDEIILGCLHFDWLLFKNMGEMLISEIKQTKFGSANIHRIRWTVSIIRQTIYQSAYCSSSNEIDQTKQNKIVWLMWPKMHNIKLKTSNWKSNTIDLIRFDHSKGKCYCARAHGMLLLLCMYRWVRVCVSVCALIFDL